LISSFVTLA